MELLMEGQWGWSSNGAVPMNAYVAFDRNHTCWFLQALNATLHPEWGTCEWEITIIEDHDDATPPTGQLRMNLDDNWMREGFADPLGHRAEVARPAWINKFNQPPIEALLYGSWGWSTDGTEVTAHLVFLPDMDDTPDVPHDNCPNNVCLKCQFMDHNNVLVTGAGLPIPWCHWYIDYQNTQLVLSLPDEAEGNNTEGTLTGGFVENTTANAWLV